MKVPYLTLVATMMTLAIGATLVVRNNQASEENSVIESLKEEAIVTETVATVEKNKVVTDSEVVEEVELYVSPYNFETLHSTNEDIVAWIKIEDSKVDYPVVFDGTDDYLHTNLDGNSSYAGTIYVDAAAENVLNDNINIIYGHNMKNGSMFKDVDRYNQESFWNNHQEINIYMEDKELNLTPVLCCYGKADQDLRTIESSNDLEAFCKGKTISNGSVPEDFQNLYVLVTCNYAGNDYRTYLFCTAN